MLGVYFLFFLSGAAGLIYQVLWSRLLNEVFGVTVYAVTAVLVTFLGGLAWGGVALGKVSDRQKNPLRFYGILEIGIGITALLGTLTVRALDPLHMWVANRFEPSSPVLILARMLLAAFVVLPPTFLMGGTLPAITRAFVSQISRLGSALSFLYALNALGAVVGTLASGFYLIGAIGVHPTLWLAIALNVGIGLICLQLAKTRGTEWAGPAATGNAAPPAASLSPEDGGGRSLLFVMAICGFVSLGLEVVWTRMLVMIVGTSTYAFATMLSSFLVGITLGSFIARLFVDRLRDARVALGVVQVLIGLSTLATILVMERVSSGVGSRWLGGSDADWMGTILTRFGVSFAVMLVPTTLIGATFPLAGKIWAREMGSLGGHLGQIYGANTLGNILGAGLTGFALLPALGLQKCVALMGGLSLANAAWTFLPIFRSRAMVLRVVALLPLLAGAGAAVFALTQWQPKPFLVRVRQQEKDVVFYKEGLSGTTMVYQDKIDPRMRTMAIDNIKIGESFAGVDMKQQALAHFPFLLMPQSPPQTLLTVGLGTGIMIGESALHESVTRVDCVELEPSVIEGARLFDTMNHHVLDNPKVRIICDDGVNFLRRTDAKYDAIISDAKSRTTHSGNALVLSKDYYELCRKHLAPGGLMIQWIACDVPPSELRIVFRTFFDVFPYAYVWLDAPSCFMVATEQPLTLDPAWIQQQIDLTASANLRRYGWEDAYGFISLLIGDKPSLAGWLGETRQVNSLEHPVLEFYSPASFAIPVEARNTDNLRGLTSNYSGLPSTASLSGADPDSVARHQRAASDLFQAHVILSQGQAGNRVRAKELLEQAAAAAPRHGILKRVLSDTYMEEAMAAMMQRRPEESLLLAQKAVLVRPSAADTRFQLGNIYMAQMRVGEALREFEAVLRLNPDFAGAHFNIGNIHASQGQFGTAVGYFRRAVELQPNLPGARERLEMAQQRAAQSRQ
ncbi:MAG: fused MFS/spermidine synthase [Candidatus Eisenbacteria bacterium]|nr:fused MFS/spermidine synthase [Candidatus Eisenbacteria bacterium]